MMTRYEYHQSYTMLLIVHINYHITPEDNRCQILQKSCPSYNGILLLIIFFLPLELNPRPVVLKKVPLMHKISSSFFYHSLCVLYRTIILTIAFSSLQSRTLKILLIICRRPTDDSTIRYIPQAIRIRCSS